MRSVCTVGLDFWRNVFTISIFHSFIASIILGPILLITALTKLLLGIRCFVCSSYVHISMSTCLSTSVGAFDVKCVVM